ncbi:MAG: hypothetical protein HXY40_16620 [Chloroflexi bacterium]|nr:hypothetical protein [Chloroflexota bacterium]
MRAVLWVVIVCGLLVGCAAAPAATQTPPPITLPLAYTSVNGALTLNYPNGWVVTESGALIGIASDDAAMRAVSNGRPLSSGQAGAIISPFSAATVSAMAEGSGLDNPVLSTFFGLITQNLPPETSDISEIVVAGRNMAYVTLLLADGDSIGIMVDDSDGDYILLQGATAVGELTQYQEVFLEIAATLRFSPSAAPLAPETTPESGG